MGTLMTANTHTQLRWVSYFTLFVICVVIYKGVTLQSVDDDAYYSTALENRTLWEFIVTHYQEWSGRTLIETIMVCTIRFSIFWKVAIPASLLLLFYQTWKLTLRENTPPHLGMLIVAFLTFMMSGQVAASGAWWITGFYNYLLPVTLGIYGFSVITYKHEHSRISICLAITAIIIACQHEQVAISLITSLCIMTAYRKALGKSISLELIAILLGLVSAYFLFSAPGNHYRFQSEISWLPEYTSMGLTEKLMMGVDRFNAHVNDSANRIMLISVIMTFITTYQKPQAWRLKPIALTILCIFIFTGLLSQLQLAHYTGKIGFYGFIGPESWYQYDAFSSYTLTLMTYGTMACCAIYASNNYKEVLQYLGLLTLSIGMTVALAFSPTVYASGPRILYLPDILLVIYSCLLLSKVFSEWKHTSKETISGQV